VSRARRSPWPSCPASARVPPTRDRGDDERTRYVNDLLRRVADGEHVFTVAPAAAFCTDPAVGDNTSNRYDGVHFLRPGAAIYFDAVVPQLLVLPT
jgi:hypothetical protein